MNKTFNLSAIALAVSSTLLLSACGGSDSASNNAVNAAPESEVNTPMAQVSLRVKFPESEAQAAWIGDSASIEVSFFGTLAGSLDEAEKILMIQSERMPCDGTVVLGSDEVDCEDIMYGSGLLKGLFATQANLDASAPSATIELLPGKYRVEAAFKSSSGLLQETSVSYVTLGEGTHSLKLRGMEASWTAETALTLQLLGEVSEVDWDPMTDGIQTPAQALGLTSAIKGIHLPTALTFPKAPEGGEGLMEHPGFLINAGLDGWYMGDEGYGDGAQSAYEGPGAGGLMMFDEKQAMSTFFMPIVRLDDGSGGESNLYPMQKEEEEELKDNDGNIIGYKEFEVVSYPAMLHQEYVAGVDNYYLDLGGMEINMEEDLWGNETSSGSYSGQWALLLFGLPGRFWDDEGPEEPGTSYEIRYTQEYGGYYDDDKGQWMDGLMYWDGAQSAWVEDDGKTAIIETNKEAGDSWADIYTALQGQETVIADGSTITGSLIEVIGMDSGGEAPEGQMPTPLLSASLEEIAVAQGLTAKAAADGNCQTYSGSWINFSNEYKWDMENQQWVAGTFNHLLTMNGAMGQIQDQIDWPMEQKGWLEGEMAQIQSELMPYTQQFENSEEAAFLALRSKYVPDNALYSYDDTTHDWSNTGELYSDLGQIQNAMEVQGQDAACDQTCQDQLGADQTTLDGLSALVGDIDGRVKELEWRQQEVDGYQAEIDALEVLRTELLDIADLNGDGVAELFETGVYYDNHMSLYCDLQQQWDQNNQVNTWTLMCNDNEVNLVTTVPAWSGTIEETICVQPFTLKASQLQMNLGTEGEIVIE